MNNLNNTSIGIDISKHFLDVCHLPSNITKTYKNTPDGVNKLLKYLAKIPVTLVVFEPTGGYKTLLQSMLSEKNIAFSMINAKRIRNYAKANGLLAKTDKIDAHLLAEYVITMQPKTTSKLSKELVLLRKWIKYRSQIIDKIKNENQYLEHADEREIIEMITDTITYLKNHLAVIETKIQYIIDNDDELMLKQKLLMEEKGIGFITSATLLAELPELGLVKHQQIAAIFGVAPHCQDNGNFKGRRRVQGRRKRVRNALYMSVISAIKCKRLVKLSITHKSYLYRC
jgi:transposase